MRNKKCIWVFKVFILVSLVCIFQGFFFISKPSDDNSVFVNPVYASNVTNFYKINCDNVNGGYIMCNVEKPLKVEQGRQIKLVVVPNKNMKLVFNSLKVNGRRLKGNSFVMPSCDVVVTADFAKINDSLSDEFLYTNIFNTYKLLEKRGNYVRIPEYKDDIFKSHIKDISNRSDCDVLIDSRLSYINEYEVMTDVDYGVFNEDVDINFSRYDKSFKNKNVFKDYRCIFKILCKERYSDKVIKAKVSINKRFLIYIPIDEEYFKNFHDMGIYCLKNNELVLEKYKLVYINDKMYLALDFKNNGVYVFATNNMNFKPLEVNKINYADERLVIKQNNTILIIMIVFVVILVSLLVCLCIKKKKIIINKLFWKEKKDLVLIYIKKIQFKKILLYIVWCIGVVFLRIFNMIKIVFLTINKIYKKIVIRLIVAIESKKGYKLKKDEAFYKKLNEFFSIKKAIRDNMKKYKKSYNTVYDCIIPKGAEIKALKKLHSINKDTNYDINKDKNTKEKVVTNEHKQLYNSQEANVRKKTKLMILESELKKDYMDFSK